MAQQSIAMLIIIIILMTMIGIFVCILYLYIKGLDWWYGTTIHCNAGHHRLDICFFRCKRNKYEDYAPDDYDLCKELHLASRAQNGIQHVHIQLEFPGVCRI